ncbi:MAG: hypothetical protein ACON44_01465 [Candidatus Puniceispirillaceae bacterium]
MAKPTACEVFSASDRVSDLKKDFICVNDDLHQAMLESPLAIVIYAFAVLFIMFLVRRASAPIREEQDKARAAAAAIKAEEQASDKDK